MVIDSGVHASLHSNCYRQIIYANFDLKIIYPPPYGRMMWHLKHASCDHIKRAIDIFDWEPALNNLAANDPFPFSMKQLVIWPQILFLMKP